MLHNADDFRTVFSVMTFEMPTKDGGDPKTSLFVSVRNESQGGAIEVYIFYSQSQAALWLHAVGNMLMQKESVVTAIRDELPPEADEKHLELTGPAALYMENLASEVFRLEFGEDEDGDEDEQDDEGSPNLS